MLENLPNYVNIIFGLTTLVTLLLFIRAVSRSSSEWTRRNSTVILLGLLLWLILQAVLMLNNIYKTDTNSFPPKIILIGVLPTILIIILLFATSSGRQFTDSLPIVNLTYLHTVRMPVEIVLYWLFIYKTIPQLMTFEGRNFDILAGITAPFVAYFGLTKRKIGRNGILLWNIISLVLLMNIVVNALFAAPSPIQKFAFDQPNIAILHFPFSWLPTFIVPTVLLVHLVSIRQLLKSKIVN